MIDYLHRLFGILLHKDLSVVCLFRSVWMHEYLYFGLSLNSLLFVCMYVFKIFPVLVIEYAFRWCHFGISYLCFCCLFVLALLYFLAPQNAPCSFCIFLTYIIEPAISLRRSNASYWTIALETNLWVLGVLIASEV